MYKAELAHIIARHGLRLVTDAGVRRLRHWSSHVGRTQSSFGDETCAAAGTVCRLT